MKKEIIGYDIDYKTTYSIMRKKFNCFMNEAKEEFKTKDLFVFMLVQKEDCKNYIISNNIKLKYK